LAQTQAHLLPPISSDEHKCSLKLWALPFGRAFYYHISISNDIKQKSRIGGRRQSSQNAEFERKLTSNWAC
jgi:hypothetical protein